MLSTIINKYEDYIRIYQDILPNIEDGNAKRFLENSLYLSVFTSFEFFIKQIIDDYIDKVAGNIKYIDLKEPLARKFILEIERKSQINNMYVDNETKSKRAFSAFFKTISQPLSKQDLSKHIRFEFFHESKLNTHYEIVFNQILGIPDFLKNLRITHNIESNIEQTITTDGFNFIAKYCKDIRNNIAHNNDSYSISSELSMSFIDNVNTFQYIMKSIKEKYEEHNKFTLGAVIRENILDSI